MVFKKAVLVLKK